MGQLIALPLHGQDTAAVKRGHRAGITFNTCLGFAEGYVFGKQSGLDVLA